jgi:hypothetical protein
LKSLNLILILTIFLVFQTGISQNISVVHVQELEFGAFYFTGDSGGSTITVSNTGKWSATGNIQQVNSNYQAAAFRISTDSETEIRVQADKPIINILNKKGESISLETGVSYPEFPSAKQGFPAQVFIGGTLNVDSEVSTGNYSGEISINFSIHNE